MLWFHSLKVLKATWGYSVTFRWCKFILLFSKTLSRVRSQLPMQDFMTCRKLDKLLVCWNLTKYWRSSGLNGLTGDALKKKVFNYPCLQSWHYDSSKSSPTVECFIPPCLAAWHLRSLRWPPTEQRKTSAWGLGQTQGPQEGQGLCPVLHNHCCGSSAGGGHWEVMPQWKMGPCIEVPLEYWRGARWERCPKSKLRRSRWLGTPSPAPAQSVNDPSPSLRPSSHTRRPDLWYTAAKIKAPQREKCTFLKSNLTAWSDTKCTGWLIEWTDGLMPSFTDFCRCSESKCTVFCSWWPEVEAVHLHYHKTGNSPGVWLLKWLLLHFLLFVFCIKHSSIIFSPCSRVTLFSARLHLREGGRGGGWKWDRYKVRKSPKKI